MQAAISEKPVFTDGRRTANTQATRVALLAESSRAKNTEPAYHSECLHIETTLHFMAN